MAKRACEYHCGGIPCRAAACLTFPVCRSHLAWWARHNTLETVRRGALLAEIGRPHTKAVAFLGGEVVAEFCRCYFWPDGVEQRWFASGEQRWFASGEHRGAWLVVPIRPDDLAVIGDWLESKGKDAGLIRRRFAVSPAPMPSTQLSLL
jgi:hypothetical protein